MRSNSQIQDLVGSYAGWMTMLGAVGFGPFYQLGHGLRGLGLIEEGPAAGSAPPPVQASLHVLVSFITLSGLWIEHGRMVRRFEAIHA